MEEQIMSIQKMVNIIQNSVQLADKVSIMQSVVAIIFDIIMGIVGIYGVSCLYALSSKSTEAELGYHSRLKVYLCYLNSVFTDYKDDILNCFLPHTEREEILITKQTFITEIIKNFSATANEALTFLKSTDNQIPVGAGWTDQYSTLIVFLIDCCNIQNANYYKWTNIDTIKETKEQYYNKHSNNMSKMIAAIDRHHTDLEAQLYGNNSSTM